MIRAYFLLGVEDLSVPYALREEVFVKEQGFSAESERDEIDRMAMHAVLTEDGQPYATGRLFYQDGGWHIGRVCVLKEKRGSHFGDLIMRMLLDRARSLGAQDVTIGAQLTAEGFYEKFGFERCGDEYMDEHCPHVPMKVTMQKVESIVFGGCGGNCASCKGCGESAPEEK